jgi:spore coat protein U-like protein
VAGLYVVQLIVNDGKEDSLPDTVSITAETGTPTVTLTATDDTASEAEPDSGTFTFTRAGSTTASLDVLYSISGTATNGTDYSPTLSGSVTIPAGQASATVTITPSQDNLVESAETVDLNADGECCLHRWHTEMPPQ